MSRVRPSAGVRVALVVCVVSTAAIVARARQTVPADHPWPPPVQKVVLDPPPPALSAADELKTFYMPPGYHAELVASDPMIVDPILIDWDTKGRLWVLEMPGYMHDMVATGEEDPTGRVVVLEDTKHDGVMDKSTTFVEGLVRPRAMKVLDHGVLVGEPPNLWLFKDTNGDLHADTKELVTDKYGNAGPAIEHNLNSLTWALDNWMHTSEGNIDLRLKQGAFEIRAAKSPGQWSNSQDDAGRIYRNSNESVLHVDLVDQSYFLRNPSLVRTRGSYESLLGDHDENEVVFPVRPTPGVNRGYQSGVLRADGTLAMYTSACAPTVYRGDRLPAELYGNVFVDEPAANTMSRLILKDDGTAIKAQRAYDHAEFLTSTDERFRPVYMSSAPDGTLYVVDMYKPVIQSKMYVTEYLRDQGLSRHLDQPTSLGRIWRIVHDTTQRDTVIPPTDTPAELVALLSHPNGWWKDTAERLLVERGATSVTADLTRLAEGGPDVPTRLHALWTLDGLDSIQPATVIRAIDDPNRDIRSNAIRIAERWLAAPDPQVEAALVKHVDDPDWSVREQLAASLGALPVGTREAPIATMLERHGDDPVVMDAALSGLAGSEMATLDRVLQANVETPQRDAAITMLVATILHSGKSADAEAIFVRVGDKTRPAWQRSALLRGAEVAVLNAPPPGTPSVGRGGRGGAAADAGAAPAAACPTCPGARGGPGGQSAFFGGGGTGRAAGGAAGTGAAAPPAAAAGRGAGGAGAGAGGGRGGRGGPALRLDQEPVALTALAREHDDLGQRAATLEARLEWPGKPGAAAAATPLTAIEQRRFVAGQQVYTTICVACHQEDGRGKDKVAPSLVGSTLALGPATIPMRILLNGKEGPIGLMPPLGQSFTDDQIAGVLTYIRRNWGNTASAVDPAVVKTIRAAVASRTRPWTNEELTALAASGG